MLFACLHWTFTVISRERVGNKGDRAAVLTGDGWGMMEEGEMMLA